MRDKYPISYIYLQCLYLYPKQILPVVVLVSRESGTGKTTFLNWISMLFGNNSVLVDSSALKDNHNTAYATKNIIMIDETLIDKDAAVEKLKSIATAKLINVNPKFIQSYQLPFYGKIIMCTNKVIDFMRISQEEIRFWIRKLPVIDKVNTNIEDDLFAEIPFFLKYLQQMPKPDFTQSRMVLNDSEIKTDELIALKEESKSSLRKEIEIFLEDHFDKTGAPFLELTLNDIKNHWYKNNGQVGIAYIKKVLRDEMKMIPSETKKYQKPFSEDLIKINGRVYRFTSPNPVDMVLEPETDQMPF